MGAIFGQPDTGPSEEELRKQRIDAAKKREQQFTAAALQQQQSGVVQLFGPGNPALNSPGSGGNSNAS